MTRVWRAGGRWLAGCSAASSPPASEKQVKPSLRLPVVSGRLNSRAPSLKPRAAFLEKLKDANFHCVEVAHRTVENIG
jgi:hypothetical protein